MSTDYGIYCQTCKKTFIRDNTPLTYAQTLLHNASRLAAIDAHIQKLESPYFDACFDVILVDFCQRSIQGFVEWLRAHSSDCKLVVCDEYGNLWNANNIVIGAVPIEYIYDSAD